MRLDIRTVDRRGITQEILAALARNGIDFRLAEAMPGHVYIDLPEISEKTLPRLKRMLAGVESLREMRGLDHLPSEERALHRDALLAAIPDPVLAVDRAGRVLVANAAAQQVAGDADTVLEGARLDTLFAAPGLGAELRASGFRLRERELSLGGQSFQLETQPIGDGARPAGAMLMLHAPSRLGERLDALTRAEAAGFDEILGQSSAMRALRARALRVATVEAPLLIVGETGTGKELVARACHSASRRREAPFLALNCAAVTESLAESELFGYAPGAFSGAQRGGKPGLLELAHHGTVFLDEIGEMSLYLQAKLLRVLNDGTFRRVGGEREIRVDVRIISATHRRIERMVEDGRFREDLYYRLNVLQLELPPLRERAGDIMALARHFLERACAQTGRPARRLGASAQASLLAHSWPGNVRELRNVTFRAVTLSDRPVLEAADFDFARGQPFTARELPEQTTLAEAVSAFEKQLLEALYPRYPSTRKLAARLGTSHTLIARKLREYGLA